MRCESCNQYYHSHNHECSPQYKVYCESRGDTIEDSIAFYAADAAMAAEYWAEHDDYSGAEYDIVGQREEPIVCVVKDDEIEKFRVTGEAMPHYSAYLVS